VARTGTAAVRFHFQETCWEWTTQDCHGMLRNEIRDEWKGRLGRPERDSWLEARNRTIFLTPGKMMMIYMMIMSVVRV
jgi:hypothetical protein